MTTVFYDLYVPFTSSEGKTLIYSVPNKILNNNRNIASLPLSSVATSSYVIFFSSLYWSSFFKQQTFVHVVLPTEEQERFIKHYIISSFGLKLVNIIILRVALAGVENLATSDPYSRLNPEPSLYTTGHSYVCRFQREVTEDSR